MQVSQTYGVKRPAAIAARVARLSALCGAMSLQSHAAPVAAHPVQIEAETFDFTDEIAPPETLPAPSLSLPASLETVEAAARAFDALQIGRVNHALLIESFIVERETLRLDLPKLRAAEYDGAAYGVNLSAEIEAVEIRLAELDEMLVFEDDRPFILGFDDLPAAYFTA